MDQLRQCSACRRRFIIHGEEAAFLDKMSPGFGGRLESLPLPELCPGCREQCRLAFRNEWHMYRRKCDVSGKELISMYPPESRCKVYDPELWWSDRFDPLLYGRSFDFSRPFFEQFHELNSAVPKLAIQNAKSENSAYTNYSAENKNCYLCVGSANNEDCYYCSRVFDCKCVCDSYDVIKSENCYECLHGSSLYGCIFSKNCHNSSNLAYCEDCRSCRDCLGCSSLRGGRYFLFNEQLTEAGYKTALEQLRSRFGIDDFSERRVPPERSIYNVNCEDCSGDQLVDCSRCHACFSVKGSQDCRYVGSATDDRDCCDCNFMDNSELMYFSTNHRHDYRVMFSAKVWYSHETLYSVNCYNSSNLFGCSGIKHQQYCILNKSYSKEQYAEVAGRIIAHMRRTGEWGAYFPSWVSPFPYNITVAQDYYPLMREEALQKGYSWMEGGGAGQQDNKERGTVAEPAYTGALRCSASGKAFKMIKQEKELCARLGIAEPSKCPDIRQAERMEKVKRAISNYA